MQAFRKRRLLPLTLLAVGLAAAAAGCGSAKSSSSSQASKSSSMPGMSGSSTKSSTSSMPGMSGSSTMSSATGMAEKTARVACATPPAGSRTVATRSHVFILSLGPEETMYSPRQVRRTHPKQGEMMLAGRMQGSAMNGMKAGSAMPDMTAMKHLEVHICSRNGRKVVTGPSPSIVMTSGRSTHAVPVAVMEGIGEGVSDLHFGNNVRIQSGHAYAVKVTEGSDHAVFHLTAG